MKNLKFFIRSAKKIQAKKLGLIFCLGLCLFLSACMKRKIYIKTSAYACSESIPNGFLQNKSFTLVGDSYVCGVKQSDCELQTRELKKKMSLVLKSKGHSVIEDSGSDYFLVFNYGSRGETEVRNSLKYIPGETINTTGSLTGIYGYYGQYNQTTHSSGTYIFVPEKFNIYLKFLRLYVYDAKQYSKLSHTNTMPPQVWSGLAIGKDGYADLRTYLDFLLIHLFDLFGKNGEVIGEFSEDDERVIWLRQEMPK